MANIRYFDSLFRVKTRLINPKLHESHETNSNVSAKMVHTTQYKISLQKIFFRTLWLKIGIQTPVLWLIYWLINPHMPKYFNYCMGWHRFIIHSGTS